MWHAHGHQCHLPAGINSPGNIVTSHYQYMDDLLALEAMSTSHGPQCFIPATPLSYLAWQGASQFVDYILAGIRTGVHIGADRSHIIRRARGGNLPSVRELPSLVDQHTSEERSAGRFLGPLPLHLASACQISPISLIPKPHQPGKWRLIFDLSSPEGGSVNDAIAVDHCHMHYASVLDAAEVVRQLGQGTLLTKIDLHHTYRIVPVHSDEHSLQGMQWRDDTFIDTALPFGLRLAPRFFLLSQMH